MDESQPPPPPSPPPPADVPPPPSGPPASVPPPPGPPSAGGKDNPIAIAGLTVSVLGLVLAIVVIGGFFGLIGMSLSAIALRRSREGLGRRGMAITGLVLGLLAMVLSIGGLLWLMTLASGEETVRNGIVTTSQNESHPPQDDLDATVCAESNSGRFSTASVRITNRSEGASVYRIEVEWTTEDGDTVVRSSTTEYVDEGASVTVDFVDTSGRGLVDSCRVIQIDRLSLPFFFG